MLTNNSVINNPMNIPKSEAWVVHNKDDYFGEDTSLPELTIEWDPGTGKHHFIMKSDSARWLTKDEAQIIILGTNWSYHPVDPQNMKEPTPATLSSYEVSTEEELQVLLSDYSSLHHDLL